MKRLLFGIIAWCIVLRDRHRQLAEIHRRRDAAVKELRAKYLADLKRHWN